jgi:hypothetical protein
MLRWEGLHWEDATLFQFLVIVADERCLDPVTSGVNPPHFLYYGEGMAKTMRATQTMAP